VNDWHAPMKDGRCCALCGFPHGKGDTFNHAFVSPTINAFEDIAPGQRIPFAKGAAVAFGLMGMAFAIEEGLAWCKVCRDWRLDCACPYVPTERPEQATKETP
jgi:hypothetical protein